MSLINYLRSNTITCRPEDAEANVIFFGVRKGPQATSDALKSTMAAHEGVFCNMNPLDGKEHNYLELGGWVGDQEAALLLIGLGAALGIWKLLTPYTVLGALCPPAMAKQMAGMGMVCMQVVADAKTDALD
jgi:hypothetical protein